KPRHVPFAVSIGVAVALGSPASLALAQASEPVTSSVFTHRIQIDDGPESNTINNNWSFITNPPAKPVAASEPDISTGQRHGRGGGRGGAGGHGTRGTNSASGDGSNGTTNATSNSMPNGTGNDAPAAAPSTASSPGSAGSQ
ncbi:MAG TPA: hypothetical protein VL424_14620, partial [Pararobbsia sp.]|nr:hypothetical protein [Pararobbsia sp.]